MIQFYENEVMNEIDSIKIIQLSNNDTIWLSKNHGIVKFQEWGHNYELKGIEGRDIGELVPNFWDFYNFEIGDVFQYEHKDITYDGSLFQWNVTTKYEILSKKIDSTKYVYEVFRVSNTSYTTNSGTFPTSSGQGVDTLTFELSDPNYYTELYNRTLVQYDEYALCSGEIRNFIGIYKDSTDNKIVKKTGNPFPYNPDRYTSYQFINYFEPVPELLSDTLVTETCAANFYYEFKEGVGLIYSSLSDFEYGKSSKLVGYIKGIDTVGIISHDADILISTEEIVEDFSLVNIFPNPSRSGKFEISFNSTEKFNLDIFDINGRKIHSSPKAIINNNTSINLNNYPSGIYILRLSNQNSLKSYRLIKI